MRLTSSVWTDSGNITLLEYSALMGIRPSILPSSGGLGKGLRKCLVKLGRKLFSAGMLVRVCCTMHALLHQLFEGSTRLFN